MSAARPVMCALLGAPPTLRLYVGHRAPLVMCIGKPHVARRVFNRVRNCGCMSNPQPHLHLVSSGLK